MSGTADDLHACSWFLFIILIQRTIHRQNTHWFRGMAIVTEGLYTRGSSCLTFHMAKGMPANPRDDKERIGHRILFQIELAVESRIQ